jgi:hypothetical protein
MILPHAGKLNFGNETMIPPSNATRTAHHTIAVHLDAVVELPWNNRHHAESPGAGRLATWLCGLSSADQILKLQKAFPGY